MLTIRNAEITDLPELVVIESLCFSKEEAATKAAFAKRMQLIPDSFLVAEIDGEIAGLVNGPVIEIPYITDDLFSDIKENPVSGGHQSVLGLAVHPRHQGLGIASALMSHLEEEARLRGRETITLTCKENLISFYEKHGYVNCGVSNSQHGGVAWHNMIKELR